MAKSVIDKLLALEDELNAEIESIDNDALRHPLVKVKGTISHLKSSIATEKNLGRL